jgi:hypothetical protein
MYGGDRLDPHIDNYGMVTGQNIVKEYGINYLIRSAGGVTEWYSSNSVKDLVCNMEFPLHTWHKISTKDFHGVSNINPEDFRFALTLTPLIEGIPQFI